MDVHLSNWRLCSKKCQHLVHIILPEHFLHENRVPENSDLKFFAQTRFTNTLKPTPYVKVIGRFFKDYTYLEEKISGLAISLPLFLTKDGFYNPFDIVTLKIEDTDKNKIFVKFFYMTLFGGCNGIKNNSDSIEAPQEDTSSPLQKIFDDVAKYDEPNKSSINTSPLSILTDLLDNKNNFVSKHHRALEDPGLVRGVNSHPQTKAKQKPKRVSIHLNFIDFQKANVTFIAVTHIISQCKFIICTYNNLALRHKKNFDSIFNHLPLSKLQHVKPMDSLLLEMHFLEEVQLGCIHSLEKACWDNGLIVYQKLPVSIEGDDTSLQIIKLHFAEALLVLRQNVSENSAWIKASVSSYMGNFGVWADLLNLWEMGPSTLGLDISYLFSPEAAYKESVFWAQLLQSKDILEVACKPSKACLVVDSSLVAWLIIPGGFAIKGEYSVASEALEIIALRYG
nr:homolog of EHV2 ORF32 DNA packaging tegument protein UL17 [Macronycteris gammaherpesvirus 1]